jgi:Family of unknown function (DUF5715)
MRTPFVAFVTALALLAAPARAWGGDESLLVAKASSQAIQNVRANTYHLSRLRDRAMVRRFHAAGLLVSVPSHARYYYLHAIPAGYRYLRPWAKVFLQRLSQEYYAKFKQRLRVTSLVRTVGLQVQLMHGNPNAARATGPYRSSHLTGAALDISKRFMDSRSERWMRHVLLDLKRSGYVYAVEEFEEPCFHMMVYPIYRQYVARLTGHSEDAELGQ